MDRTSWKAYSPGSYNPSFHWDKVLDNIVGDNQNVFICTRDGGRQFQYIQIDFGVSEVSENALK